MSDYGSTTWYAAGLQRGCRCDECTNAQRRYQQRYREGRANGETPPAPAAVVSQPVESGCENRVAPGPVERGVQAEIAGPGAQARPGLAQAALAMARLIDNQRTVNQHAAAAKVLATLLDRLHSASARGRRDNLALVRTMTKKNGGA